eukprot:scpid74672/ scgid34095/ 
MRSSTASVRGKNYNTKYVQYQPDRYQLARLFRMLTVTWRELGLWRLCKSPVEKDTRTGLLLSQRPMMGGGRLAEPAASASLCSAAMARSSSTGGSCLCTGMAWRSGTKLWSCS